MFFTERGLLVDGVGGRIVETEAYDYRFYCLPRRLVLKGAR